MAVTIASNMHGMSTFGNCTCNILYHCMYVHVEAHVKCRKSSKIQSMKVTSVIHETCMYIDTGNMYVLKSYNVHVTCTAVAYTTLVDHLNM